MNTKLTLSLDERIIAQAKLYAKQQGTSLSEIVENYFRKITSEYPIEKSRISDEVRELIGSVGTSDESDYESLKYRYLHDKYMTDEIKADPKKKKNKKNQENKENKENKKK
jgi:hypothetical protein